MEGGLIYSGLFHYQEKIIPVTQGISVLGVNTVQASRASPHHRGLSGMQSPDGKKRRIQEILM
jgi:hypothetical protein